MSILFLISIGLNIVLASVIAGFYLRNKFLKVTGLEKTYSEREQPCSNPDIPEKTNTTAPEAVSEKLLDEIKGLMPGFNNQEGIVPSTEKILQKIASSCDAVQGAFYLQHKKNQSTVFRFVAGYAFYLPESKPIEYEAGEGLVGQAAKDKKILTINSAPFEHAPVFSGLGQVIPQHLIICPLVKGEETVGVMEFSAFKPFSSLHETALKSTAELLAEKIEVKVISDV